MKESTGSVASIYLIIFFIVILFGFIASILNYYKGYKIVNSIAATIEDYAGFHAKSMEDIEKRLDNYGYKRLNGLKCDAEGLVIITESVVTDGSGVESKDYSIKIGASTQDEINNRGYKGYCVNIVDAGEFHYIGSTDMEYYYYKVTTAMGIDFSFGLGLTLPIEAKTDIMYSRYGEKNDDLES